jgi:hypothetical protein
LLLRWSRRHMHENTEQQNDENNRTVRNRWHVKMKKRGWSTWLLVWTHKPAWGDGTKKYTSTVLVCNATLLLTPLRHTTRPSQSLVIASE